MKQMTYSEALNIVSQTINAIDIAANGFTIDQQDKLGIALERIEALREKYSAPRTTSDEAKAKRKAKTAQEREALVAEVTPIVFNAMDETPRTAAEIYERCSDELPDDWTINKVQYLLLHELKYNIAKFEIKGKPNTYAYVG